MMPNTSAMGGSLRCSRLRMKVAKRAYPMRKTERMR